MTRRTPTRARQRGAALIVIAALLVLGVAWGAFAAINRGNSLSAQEREVLTGKALAAAKQALLAYAAHYAARTDHDKPGRMPCPEGLTSIGTAAEGDENAAGCSNTMPNLGRLPWRTLGIDRLDDGSGEPLWYALSPGFRGVSPTTMINFDTPGQLTYDGTANAAVAVIIAPGRPLNTLADGGTLPGWCAAKVNQYAAGRTTAPIDPANFLECGNATGSYRNPGSSQWSNDRAITITAAEWAVAIAGAVSDRIQRQVAPAIRTWDADEFAATGRSWGATHGLPYLPFAADWGNPTTSSYCGNQGTVRGLIPLDPSCHNNPWAVVNVSTGGLLSIFGGGSGCTDMGTHLRCRFQRILGIGGASATIELSASNVARAFRSTLQAGDVTLSNTNGTKAISMALSNSTSDATMTVDLTWPGNLLLLALFEVVTVNIPHLQDAQIYSDPRLTWFWSNQWQRYTWYAISPGAAASPSFANRCNSAGDPGCLTVNGLPTSTGSTNDKRLVLVLSARPLPGSTQPSSNVADYFEGQNASIGVIYETASVDADFNDRVAACPFKYQNHLGADVVICN